MLTPPLCSTGTVTFLFVFHPKKENHWAYLRANPAGLWLALGLPRLCTPWGSTYKTTSGLATSLPANLTLPLQQEAELEHMPSTMQAVML